MWWLWRWRVDHCILVMRKSVELTILVMTKVIEICAPVGSRPSRPLSSLPPARQTRSHLHNCNFSSLEFFGFPIYFLVSFPRFVRFRPGCSCIWFGIVAILEYQASQIIYAIIISLVALFPTFFILPLSECLFFFCVCF